MNESLQKELLLEVNNLSIEFQGDLRSTRVVDDVSFQVNRGEILGLVGESGCGKSVTALSLTQLLPRPAGKINSGSIIYKNQELQNMSEKELHSIRSNEIGMIFQEPMTALNPVHNIGRQLIEALQLHKKLDSKNALIVARDLLVQVGIPSPEVRLTEYPHQLSGGMRQRILIAMGLICEPDLLIADEPTTALDVTIQAQIIRLLKDLAASRNLSIIFITHDLGVVAQLCDRVLIMYSGKIVEQGNVFDIYDNPSHPYTIGLLNSIPKMNQKSGTHLKAIPGQVPAPGEVKSGCRFENRCEQSLSTCNSQYPHSISNISIASS